MSGPRQTHDRSDTPFVSEDAIDRPFESEAATPVLAVGTRDDITIKARAAVVAAESSSPASTNDDVAALAHDLKNPLTIIMLEANQIEQRLGTRATPAVLRGLERIAQNAAYIDRLVSDLLDAASAEAGKLDLRIERIDMTRLVRGAVERAVATPERGRIHIEVRDIVYVEGDEIRLERVLANLLSNAVKYSEPGAPITVRVDQRGQQACVSVIDQGQGMTADESRRVFEKYRRATASTQQGYGLGLYTCRRIIEAHQGRIGVVSTPGRGSRFFFELPVVG